MLVKILSIETTLGTKDFGATSTLSKIYENLLHSKMYYNAKRCGSCAEGS